VASRSLPLLYPQEHPDELRELTRAAAFISHAQVRILDSNERVLVDSGPHTTGETLVWLGPPGHGPYAPVSSAAGGNAPARSADSQLPIAQPTATASSSWPQVMSLASDTSSSDTTTTIPGTGPAILMRRFGGPESEQFDLSVRDIHGAADHPFPPPPMTTTLSAAGDLLVADARGSAPSVRAPIGEPGSPPVGYVEVISSADPVAQSRTTAARAFALAGLAATLLAIVVGLVVSRGLTAPIMTLTAAAGRMSAGDLTVRAPVRGGDEIGQLGSEFNQMAERLEASFGTLEGERDALRHFIADASHELRTPLTALKTFITLLRDGTDNDPAARAEFLALSQAQVARLEWITQNLLDLSRLEAGLVALDLAEHDLGELLSDVVVPFQARAKTKGIALATVLPEPPCLLRCDAPRIELALTNLLDNALKFTPNGGAVTIGADAEPVADDGVTRVRLWVEDNGPGVDPVDQPRIFDRFYRGQAVADSTAGPASNGGSGLGLAIVTGVAQVHGGRVWLESPEGGGSRFVIELPSDGPDATAL
jgi:signal transduction histidine kinase